MWLTTTGLLVTPSWHQATNTGQLMGHKCCPRCPLTSCNSIQNKRQQQQKKSPDTAGHFPRFICHSGPMDWFQRNWSATVAHQTQSCKKKKKSRKWSGSCQNAETTLHQEEEETGHFWLSILEMEPLPPALQTECSFEKITPRSVVKKKVVYSGFVFIFEDPLISVSVCVRVVDKVSTSLLWGSFSRSYWWWTEELLFQLQKLWPEEE